MSNRTLVELNHDFCPKMEQLAQWAEAIRTYLLSGDKWFLPQGVTLISMRHHSEPSTIPTVRELALSRLSVKYQEDGKWRINYTMQNGSIIGVVSRHSAEMAIAQIAGIVADVAESSASAISGQFHVALWFDAQDKLFRIAGIYDDVNSAWNRVAECEFGTVQTLHLNEAVLFTHESAQEKCGKPVCHLIAGASYFACVLSKNHEGKCKPGGTCIAHGEYVSEVCPPECPECKKDNYKAALEKQTIVSSGPTNEQVRQAREWLDKTAENIFASRVQISQLLAAYGLEREKPLLRGFVNLYEIATGQKATFDERVGMGMATSAVAQLKQRAESAETERDASRAEHDDWILNWQKRTNASIIKARTEAIREERQRCAAVARSLCGNDQTVAWTCDRVAFAIERQAIEADAPAGEFHKASRTYGELPESVRDLIAPHEWDNKNISEQRDWALSILAEIQDADYVLNVDRAWKKRQQYVRKETAREILKWMRTAALSANGDIYYSHLQSKLESILYTNEKEGTMQPHQERVVTEKKELDAKLDKLKAFIEINPVFKTLPQTEQLLLNRQFDAMAEYSHILSQRISAWESVDHITKS